MQVEDVNRRPGRTLYDDVVIAGFGFGVAAQAAMESGRHSSLRILMGLVRPDAAMDYQLRSQPGDQPSVVFAAARVRGPNRARTGEPVVAIEGMDVIDPVSGALHPAKRQPVAARTLIPDLDIRAFRICRFSCPHRSRLGRREARLHGDEGAEEWDASNRLSGSGRIPFQKPSRLADSEACWDSVKNTDLRGNEGLPVLAERN